MMPPPIKRPRFRGRRTFAATVTRIDDHDLATLELEPGAWLREIDKAGGVVADTRDERVRLWANLGDRLIVSSPAVDPMDEHAVAAVEVVDPSRGPGVLVVRFLRGAIRVGPAHVIPGRKAKPARAATRKRAGTRGAGPSPMRGELRNVLHARAQRVSGHASDPGKALAQMTADCPDEKGTP